MLEDLPGEAEAEVVTTGADEAGAEATTVAGPAVTAVTEGGPGRGLGIEDLAPGPTPGTTGGPGTRATPGAGEDLDQRVAAGAAEVANNESCESVQH